MKKLLLLCLLLLASPAFAAPFGTVTGRVDCRAAPGCPGLAALWETSVGAPPDPRKYLLVPATVAPLQADGVFSLSAPPGDYYVGAFLRTSPGPQLGPPRAGDLIYLTPDPSGQPRQVTLIADETADAGIHAEAWPFAGLTQVAPPGVRGQLLDTEGRPVAGLLVLAFADATVSLQPLAVSTRSDANGEFLLPLPQSGKVYLRARKNYRGGLPQAGDYVGVFGGAAPKPLLIPADRFVAGLWILVRKIPQQLQLRNAPGTASPQLQRRSID